MLEIDKVTRHCNTTTHKRANLEVTQLLITEGGDVNNKNNVNETPLHWAVNRGNLDIAKILVDNGANVNEQTISGDTPLNLAIQNYRECISLLLINEGADPNIENNAGDAPLHIAAWNNNLKITEWLIKNGANVNKQDMHGNTPLHLAVSSDSKYVIDYLVKNSQCNFNIKNNIGKNPLELANYWCKTDIASFLSSEAVKSSWLKNQTEELTNKSFGQLEWVNDKPSGITWEFKETPNTSVKAKSESELNSQEKLHNQDLSLNEPQAGTSFNRSTIFKLEAETAKVAEQMLAKQAKEKQAREKRQQEKEQQAREKRQQEKEKRRKEKTQQEEPLSN